MPEDSHRTAVNIMTVTSCQALNYVFIRMHDFMMASMCHTYPEFVVIKCPAYCHSLHKLYVQFFDLLNNAKLFNSHIYICIFFLNISLKKDSTEVHVCFNEVSFKYIIRELSSLVFGKCSGPDPKCPHKL